MGIKASASVTIADISDGIDGTGISGTVVEYQAGSSGTTAPTGTWSTTVPATSASAPYLWTRVTYTYTDGSTPKVVYSVGSTPEGIVVGGRNLAQRTSSSFTNAFTSFRGIENHCLSLAKVLTDGLSVGDTVTVKLIYKYTDVVATSGHTACCRIQGLGNVTQWNAGGFNFSTDKILSGSGEHEFLYSFKITANHLKNSYWVTQIRHDYVQSGSVQWKMFKVEKGNKATDWTPAPEDVEAGIGNAQSSANNAQTSANTAIDKANTAQSSADEANATLLDWCYNNNKVYINGSKIYAGTVTATQIAAKAVTADKLSVSTLSAICADLGSVTAGSINIGNGKFVVDSSGNLTSQYIVATGGKIGCWNISATEVNNGQWGNGFGTGFGYRSGTDFSGTDMAFWAGDGVFRVNYNGSLYASNATITGSIEATSMLIKNTLYLANPNNASAGSAGISYSGNRLVLNGDYGENQIGSGVLQYGNLEIWGSNQSPINLYGCALNECSIAYNYNPSAGIQWVVGAGAGYGNMEYFGFYNNNHGNVAGIYKNGVILGSSFWAGNTTYNNGSIELYAGTPFIDFHFGNSTADYTSRIIAWGESGRLDIIGSSRVLIVGGGYAVTMGAGFTSGTVTFGPRSTGNAAADNKVHLGASSSRWSYVHAASGTIQTSDERDKNIIGPIDQRYLDMYMDLETILYRWKDGDDQVSVHAGIGAQTTERIAASHGIYDKDLAILYHEYWDEPNEDGRTDRYGVNYGELSVLTIPIVQNHERRLDSTDNKIENLQTLLMEALDKIAAQEKLIEQLQTS